MKRSSLYFFLILSVFSALPAAATSMLPISLEQLSTRADLIFYGKIISNEVKKDTQSGQIATFTNFKIINLIKGNAGNTHTIKQLGGFDKSSNTRLMIRGVPKFIVGEEYVVFLPKKSSLGFCSPLGLHQGSFPVSTEKNEKVIGNGRNLAAQPVATSRSVQIPLAVRAGKPSQSRLDDFINTVRAYNTH